MTPWWLPSLISLALVLLLRRRRMRRTVCSQLPDDVMLLIIKHSAGDVQHLALARQLSRSWHEAGRMELNRLRFLAAGGYLGAFNRMNAMSEHFDFFEKRWKPLTGTLVSILDGDISRPPPVPNEAFAAMIGSELHVLSVHENVGAWLGGGPHYAARMSIFDVSGSGHLVFASNLDLSSPVDEIAAVEPRGMVSDGERLFVLLYVKHQYHGELIDGLTLRECDRRPASGSLWQATQPILEGDMNISSGAYHIFNAKFTVLYYAPLDAILVAHETHLGVDPDQDDDTPDIHVFYLRRGWWTSFRMSCQRKYAGVGILGHHLFVVGGLDPSEGYDEFGDARSGLVEFMDLYQLAGPMRHTMRSVTWKTWPCPMMQRRRDASVIGFAGFLWVVGGASLSTAPEQQVECMHFSGPTSLNEQRASPWFYLGAEFASCKHGIALVACSLNDC